MKPPIHCQFEAQALAAMLEYRWPHAVERLFANMWPLVPSVLKW